MFNQCLTYVLHRYAIHSSPSFLRSLHMNWQHSVSPPYSIIAHYDHPLPYVLHIFVPTYVPAVLCRFHLLTYYIYLTLVSLEETFAYSGYNVLPSGFLLSGIARRREQHFLEDAQGNYGCLGLIDLIFGTSLGDGLVNNVRGHVKTQNLVNKVQRNVKGPERKIKRKTSLT